VQQAAWLELTGNEYRAPSKREAKSHQELPEMPMMLRGLQVKPTWPVTGPRTMPKREAMRPTAGLLASWTLLQQCKLPDEALQGEEAGGGVPPGAAMARVARARVERSLNCMLLGL
jgi:hypothetical protein